MFFNKAITGACGKFLKHRITQLSHKNNNKKIFYGRNYHIFDNGLDFFACNIEFERIISIQLK